MNKDFDYKPLLLVPVLLLQVLLVVVGVTSMLLLLCYCYRCMSQC